jgi:RNA polymerase sigma factor (sigma-70 family)
VTKQWNSFYPDFTDGNLLKMYMQDAQRSQLLTGPEEVSLAKRVEAGQLAQERLEKDELTAAEREAVLLVVEDAEDAREHLISSNIRLVISVAKKHRGRGLTFLDLIQEGNMGLMIAVDKYDYTVGTRFSTYATWWIRHAITRAIENKSRAIRIPSHMDKSVREIYKAMRHLEQEKSDEPSVGEVADYLERSPADIEYLLEISRNPLSLERPTSEDSDSTLVDIISDNGNERMIETVSHRMIQAEIDAGLKTALTPREAEIVRLRFGLGGQTPLTLKEIGKMFSLTKERIRQIEKKALKKLRQAGNWSQLYAEIN